MKARELRIGNLVLLLGGALHSLERSDFKYERGLTNLEDLRPVPLTEQWLIDFGFKHNPIVLVSSQYLLDIGRNRMLSFSDVGTPNFTVWLQSVEGNKVTDLVCLHNWDYDKDMFVHQLQNLYFALTGEDLQL